MNCLTHEITLLRQVSGWNEFICEFYMWIVVPSNYLYITVISLPVFRRLWLGPTTLLFCRTKMVTWSDIVLSRKKKTLFAALIKRKTLWGCGKTSALLAIFTKVAVKDINKLSLWNVMQLRWLYSIKLAYEDVNWLCNCLCGYFSTKMIYKAVVSAERG